MKECLTPSVGLLCKLGSIAQHVDEMLSAKGHAFDRHALETVLRDPEVIAWLKEMDKLALIPRRR